MKRLFACLSLAALFACNSSDKSTAEVNPGETKVASMSIKELPYEVKDWGDWQTGSMENVKTVMQSLKDFETGDIAASVKNFADSAELRFDDINGKFSKDSIQKMFTKFRGMSKEVKIEMEDFETVKSKDGKYEYVSLWYKQKWQDEKGNWDSVICMDDVRIQDGKIVVLDEKLRHFPKKKM